MANTFLHSSLLELQQRKEKIIGGSDRSVAMETFKQADRQMYRQLHLVVILSSCVINGYIITH